MKKMDCYRSILKQEYEARKKSNTQYSRAAFARDLKLAPPKLSQILSGKCGLSKARAEKVAKYLGLTESEAEYFTSLVTALHARSWQERETAKALAEKLSAKATVSISSDQFELMKDWHHLAILNLLASPNVKKEAKSLSQRLSLPIAVVRDSLKLLKDMGFLNENLTPVSDAMVKTTQDVPSRAIKHHQEQILKKVALSLQKDPVDEREIHSLMFLASQKEISAMKEQLRVQSFQFMKKFESEQSEDLYSLSVQLVPMTKGEK